jgi:hypothetical protein
MSSIKRKIERLEKERSAFGLTQAELIELARSMQGGALIPGKVYPYSKVLNQKKSNDR